MAKNKKLILAAVGVIVLLAVLVGVYFATRPDTDPAKDTGKDRENIVDQNGPDQNNPDQNNPDQNNPDQNGPDQNGPDQNGPDQNNPEEDGPEKEEPKSFTVEVVHSDGETKTFSYSTEEEYLGKVLTEEGLISVAANGVYDTVDGEKADWDADMAYWAFYIGEEYATVGPDDAPIHDGDTFKFVYTASTGEW